MEDVITLFSVLIFLGVLVRLKINIGITILLSGVMLAIFKHIPLIEITRAFYVVATAWDTIKLTLIVVIITYFVELLKEAKFLDRMVKSFSEIFSAKFFVPIFALIIGTLPLPGGALISAPLVNEGMKKSSTTPEEKTVINFWFRHVWQPTSPLYPDMLLASSILGVSILRIIFVQWPFSVLMIISGLIFLIPKINCINCAKRKISKSALYELLLSIMPIFIVLSLILIFHISIILSGIVGIIYVIIARKLTPKNLLKAFRWRLLLKLAILMFSIFYLKHIFIKTGIIDGIYVFLNERNFPHFFILFSLPFIVSLMTGAAAATVGVSYPLLLPLLLTPQLNNANLFIAFLGGWSALMLTPTHLCLSLSMEYFDAMPAKMYPLLLKNIIFLMLCSTLWFLAVFR